MVNKEDNLIIGGGLAGGITSLILSRQGFPGVLLEQGGHPYGANGSMQDDYGHHFDFGGHCIYEKRSKFTSQFFRQVQNGHVRRFPLKRSIILEDHRIPYAAPLEQWPETLQDRIHLNPEAEKVTLGSSRNAFAEAYGVEFADLLFDDVLESFPSLKWLRKNGEPEEGLMRWVFPWFVPLTDLERAPRPNNDQSGFYIHESRSYHFDMRYSDQPETILYPSQGGFGNWIESIFEEGKQTVDVRLNRDRIDLEFDGDTPAVKSVQTDEDAFDPDRVFWCAPISALCEQIGWELPEKKRQFGALGNFTFEEEVPVEDHEILLGNPDHDIRRVTQPARFGGTSPAVTLQVEFYFPEGTYDRTEEEWKQSWLNSLRTLGLVDESNPVKQFQFLSAPMGVVVDREHQEALNRVRDRVRNLETNLIVPDVKVGPGNSSRSVPRIFHRVYESLVQL